MCVGCGGKTLEIQKVMALLICFENAFQVGVRFALGLGWELWLLVGYEGCANNTFVFVMKEKKLEEKTLKKHQSATTLTWYLHFSCVCNKT